MMACQRLSLGFRRQLSALAEELNEALKSLRGNRPLRQAAAEVLEVVMVAVRDAHSDLPVEQTRVDLVWGTRTTNKIRAVAPEPTLDLSPLVANLRVPGKKRDGEIRKSAIKGTFQSLYLPDSHTLWTTRP